MLLEFLCSNHKSIRRPVLFSTVASKDRSNMELLTSFKVMIFLDLLFCMARMVLVKAILLMPFLL